MSWITFAVALWAALGLELGLRPAPELGGSGIAPSFVVILVVFIAMHAPAVTVLGAALFAGLMLDLTHTVPLETAADSITIVGPYALGMMAGAYAVVVTRSLVMQHNILTYGFLAFLASMVLAVVTVTLFTLRSYYDPFDFAPGAQLMSRTGAALFTALVAIVLVPALRLTTPLFGFPPGSLSRRRGWM
jgi:rod shape-determining protein MreD